jgi:multiple sugar transport system permease protein/sn-glycerol 3-phosphate transport system permease protein
LNSPGAAVRNGRTRLWTRIPQYLLLVVVGLVAIAPVYWVLTSSVKASGDIYHFPPDWFPTHWRFANFTEAWNAAPFDRFYLNSIIVTLAGTCLQITIALFCAYAFVFLPFPAKGPLFLLMLGAMMVPGNVVLMPNYLTIAALGWVNTYQGLIIPQIGSVFAMFLLRQHMMTLPGEVMEAAKVDGASHLRILWQVVVPMSRPRVVTVVIVSIVERWNDFIWPLVSTSVDSMRTLPVGLLQMQNAEGYTNWGAVMAATVFVVVPVLIVFFIAQRHIIAGLTQGATKG